MKVDLILITFLIVFCLHWKTDLPSAFASEWGYVLTDIYPETVTNAVKTDEIYAASLTACAVEAKKRKDSSFVCYEDYKCSFYEALTCPLQRREGTKPGNCFTKVNAPSHPLPCPKPFMEVQGVGCIYIINTTMTFDQGMGNCSLFCASLYVHRDTTPFATFQAYLSTTNVTYQYWVGIRAREWLDGRAVRPGEEWGPRDPNGAADECARMRFDAGNFWAMDVTCSQLHNVICHIR